MPAFSRRRWRFMERRMRRSSWFYLACIVTILASAAVVDFVTGQLLVDRDILRADLDASEARVDACLAEWGVTIARAHLLRAELRDIAAASEDRVCSCWTPEAP